MKKFFIKIKMLWIKQWFSLIINFNINLTFSSSQTIVISNSTINEGISRSRKFCNITQISLLNQYLTISFFLSKVVKSKFIWEFFELIWRKEHFVCIWWELDISHFFSAFLIFSFIPSWRFSEYSFALHTTVSYDVFTIWSVALRLLVNWPAFDFAFQFILSF